MTKVISTSGSREGRGFSPGEIISAGLALHQAKRMKIQIDSRRRSVHDFNVKELSEMAAKYAPSAKTHVEGAKKKKKDATETKVTAVGTSAKKGKATTSAARTPKKDNKE